jgi:hypothetical protein
MADVTLTQDYLCQLFDYKNGELFWKNHKYKALNGRKVGANLEGYVVTAIKKKPIYNHRIIFMMFHGYFPYHIDHINGIKNDNRIENLRPATKIQNAYNRKTSKNNTSGAKGVRWDKKLNRWIAKINVDGKQKYFGSFKDIELAELVVTEARNKYHGEFANYS